MVTPNNRDVAAIVEKTTEQRSCELVVVQHVAVQAIEHSACGGWRRKATVLVNGWSMRTRLQKLFANDLSDCFHHGQLFANALCNIEVSSLQDNPFIKIVRILELWIPPFGWFEHGWLPNVMKK